MSSVVNHLFKPKPTQPTKCVHCMFHEQAHPPHLIGRLDREKSNAS